MMARRATPPPAAATPTATAVRRPLPPIRPLGLPGFGAAVGPSKRHKPFAAAEHTAAEHTAAEPPPTSGTTSHHLPTYDARCEVAGENADDEAATSQEAAAALVAMLSATQPPCGEEPTHEPSSVRSSVADGSEDVGVGAASALVALATDTVAAAA
jgi:hypothetical protein